ncbi:cation-translocating P-type ATPase [Gryllotalpicola protaetiae]|uniref:HAD family hydrolase n=1 Tax=Gryllotalpicola protaetiae TaxID=2419771 RepID=A0A387BNP1_9MICO|nr:HAD-IC family P-type ATPase [Gryllotalpicola protaetiae]AYG02739.1 HAD family hydrolase [Gryllotalpicola protaetiae]
MDLDRTIQTREPWATTSDAVLAELGGSEAGLTAAEASGRLALHGRNVLTPPKPAPWWKRVLLQFKDVLIYVLLASALLKAIIGDWVDFAVILAVAIINAVIGLVQEGRAEQALNAIRGMLSTQAHVMRAGVWIEADAAELVPGDVVRVRAGDRVPADLRLLDAANLQVDESALTGEAEPATKFVEAVAPGAELGDRTSMMFSGTLVAAGTGRGVVVATGENTEIGHIQTLVSEVETVETPLAIALARFGRLIAWTIVAMTVVMTAIGFFWHGFGLQEVVSAAIGFAVAAIPEGLPALVTITLALGVQQMARRNAITRRLPAVEALGSVTVICSDKTGTLTKNEMTARSVRTAAREYDVVGTGYEPVGAIMRAGAPAAASANPDLLALAEAVAVCNDARVVGAEGDWRIIGAPTEGALAVLGLKAEVDAGAWRREAEVPFDSETKYMAVLARGGAGEAYVFLKGAPDRVLPRASTQTQPDGSSAPIDLEHWQRQISELGQRGLRVLAAARRRAAPAQSALSHDDLTGGFEFIGVVGIVDPPRPEAINAIATSHRAGVAVKMITGDHPDTALSIAREMGITSGADAGQRVLTGAELEAMSDDELRAMAADVDVYARTSPEHKIRIVSALQHEGEVVAMTGDGVNDAPALTQADVGVAMGLKGTEATKEAADLVLTDDNFATIERAVEEGRRIYSNIRKSILFLLPTNGAQALVILIAVLVGATQLPLEPVQVLWINMATSVTLSLSLAGAGAEPGLMDQPPRGKNAPLLDARMGVRIGVVSLLIGAATLFTFYFEIGYGETLAQSQTTAVTTLALCQLAYLFSCRFLDQSSLTLAVFRGNRVIYISAGALIVLQLAFVYLPFMHDWFGSGPIDWHQWGLSALLAIVIFLLAEVNKRLTRSIGDQGVQR